MIYYGKNAIPYWYIHHLARRRYRNYVRGRSNTKRALHELPVMFQWWSLQLSSPSADNSEEHFRNRKTTRAIEYIEDLPELPFPIRRLTPGGRVYEIAKDLAIGLIVWDPLGIIDD